MKTEIISPNKHQQKDVYYKRRTRNNFKEIFDKEMEKYGVPKPLKGKERNEIH